MNFRISPYLLDMILNDNFANPNDTFSSTKLYVGLGIDFDENSFSFTKEPVSKGFTIFPTPVEFDTPVNGILRNKNAIEWPKAEVDWTVGTDAIQYIGLYYKLSLDESNSGSDLDLAYDVLAKHESTSDSDDVYRLVIVLPLSPNETVLAGERMVLNANSIMIRLANR